MRTINTHWQELVRKVINGKRMNGKMAQDAGSDSVAGLVVLSSYRQAVSVDLEFSTSQNIDPLRLRTWIKVTRLSQTIG